MMEATTILKDRRKNTITLIQLNAMRCIENIQDSKDSHVPLDKRDIEVLKQLIKIYEEIDPTTPLSLPEKGVASNYLK